MLRQKLQVDFLFCSFRQYIINKTYMMTRSCGIISKNTGHSIRLQSDGDETIESERAVACSLSVLLGSVKCSALGG